MENTITLKKQTVENKKYMSTAIPEDPILQLKKVSISYTAGKNAVNNVNADIRKKCITAIMGPSGCGKVLSSEQSTVCTNSIPIYGYPERF